MLRPNDILPNWRIATLRSDRNPIVIQTLLEIFYGAAEVLHIGGHNMRVVYRKGEID